jgi:hypothetical protein
MQDKLVTVVKYRDEVCRRLNQSLSTDKPWWKF